MGRRQPYPRQSDTQSQQSLPALRKPSSAGWELTKGCVSRQGRAPHLRPAHSLPAPSTFPCPFPWTQPAAPCQLLRQAPSHAEGTSASEAVISSVFNLPLQFHYNGPKHAPCSTGGAEEGLFQLSSAPGTSPRACCAVLKDQNTKIHLYLWQSLPDHFPYVKYQYKNN